MHVLSLTNPNFNWHVTPHKIFHFISKSLLVCGFCILLVLAASKLEFWLLIFPSEDVFCGGNFRFGGWKVKQNWRFRPIAVVSTCAFASFPAGISRRLRNYLWFYAIYVYVCVYGNECKYCALQCNGMCNAIHRIIIIIFWIHWWWCNVGLIFAWIRRSNRPSALMNESSTQECC